MPRAIDNMGLGPQAGKHIDAYQEYTQVVGRLDGGTPLPEAVYEDIRIRASNPSRRLYVNWRNSRSGLDCKAIGPQSMCLCNHRYNEHDWFAFETRGVRCKMPGCTCTCFNYLPVRGSQDLKCSLCHRSSTEHRPHDHGCPKGGGKFTCSYTCSCTSTYKDHATVFESRDEREQQGRPVDTAWMEKAAQEGLPVCHLGGIIGYQSLADGVDRAYAGLERVGDGDLAAAGGAGMDQGAARFMQRMQLEDDVNSASAVHGKLAGQRALAAAQSQRQSRPASRSSAACPRPARALSSGASQSASSAASAALPPRANVHTLAGPLPKAGAAAVRGSPPPVARGPPAAQRKTSAVEAKDAPNQRRSSSAAPASSGRTSGAAASGRGQKLGGAKSSNPEAMRQARLAHFDS